jgi:hypothetical protein
MLSTKLLELPVQFGPIRAMNRFLAFPVSLRCSFLVNNVIIRSSPRNKHHIETGIMIIATAKCSSSGSRDTQCRAPLLLMEFAAVGDSAPPQQMTGNGKLAWSSDIDGDEDVKEQCAAELFVRLKAELCLATGLDAI